MQLDKRSRNRLLLLLFAGVLMGALDIAIIGPALPAIRNAFHIDDRAAAWVLSIYVLFNLIGTPLMSKLSDIHGRRTIYILDVALFAAGSLIVALSPSFGIMLTGRSIQGFAAGGIFPVASAVIGDTFPPEKRGSALGLIGAVFGFAFLIGPIIGGLLLMVGWHWLFIVNLPFAAVIIFYSTKLIPAHRPEERPLFDWFGMLTLGSLLFAFAYALNRINSNQLFSSLLSQNVLPFLIAAVILLPIFISLERRSRAPVLNLSLFRSRQIVLAASLSGGAGLSEAAVVFVPAMLVAAFHVSTSTASFMLIPIVLTMAVGAPVSGRLLDRFGSRVVVVAGTALMSFGIAMVGIVGTSVLLFYLAAGLFGLGMSALLGSALRYIMLNEAPASERGVAQGLLTIFTSIGQLVGSAMIGAIATSRGGVAGYTEAFMILGAIMFLLMLSSFGLKSHKDEKASVHRNDAQGQRPQPRAAHS